MMKEQNKARTASKTRWLLPLCLMLFVLFSCARMGSPDGGWYDETPPKVIGAMPADNSTNVNTSKISIFFDEYVKIDNAMEKVVVSPPQMEMPEIKTAGKQIKVELKDSLKPNTTYTIDFSDAISDNNEGNPMGNFTYSFSTGDTIDTLEVSGHVLDAENLEPIKGILVGLYSNLADSAFRKESMLRVSRTDSRGRFVIRGIAPGDYRIYALMDADGDFRLTQKSEQLAFTKEVVTPWSKPDVRQDTLWLDSLRIKDIDRVNYTHFMPDDIMLLAFTEVQTDRYLVKSERKEANRFTLYFSYGSEELPGLKGLNFDERDAFVVEKSEHLDTLTYWLRDSALINMDTLNIALTYMATDTLGVLQQQTDTLELLSRDTYEKRMKREQKKYDEWKKRQERAEKRGDPFQTVMPAEMLKPKYSVKSEMSPDQNPSIEFDVPLARVDSSAIHLYSKIDSLWYRSTFVLHKRVGRERVYEIMGEWRPNVEYSLEIDSAAFVDIYGHAAPKFKQGFKVKSDDSFSTVIVNISGMEGKNVVVQLLDGRDTPVKEVSTNNGTAEFFYVDPGIYYMRLFVDDNNNGVWDTGNYDEGRHAEEVYYYHERVECKARWDLPLSWSPQARPLTHQKPYEIVKQKPDKDKKIKNRNVDRARKMGIEYIPNP